MGTRNFNFGRGIIAEGIDSTIIRRNFATLQILIDRLETVIPFIEVDLVPGKFVTSDGGGRSFTLLAAADAKNTLDVAKVPFSFCFFALDAPVAF